MTPSETLIAWVDAQDNVARAQAYLEEAPKARSQGSNPHTMCVEVNLKLAEECLRKATKLIIAMRAANKKE